MRDKLLVAIVDFCMTYLDALEFHDFLKIVNSEETYLVVEQMYFVYYGQGDWNN